MGKAFYNLDDILSIPILDVCDSLGIYVYRHGSSCFCKLREQERTASCKLYIDKGGNGDSFYDFGSSSGGNVINFVSQYLGCDWQSALEELADRFHIEPMNNAEYFNRNELTDREYEKIGVRADLATKNFDFDLEKQSLAEVQAESEKYAMPVNQLRKDYPEKYAYSIMKKRAIPYVYSLRNAYYFEVYRNISFQFSITGHFDINNMPHDDLTKLKDMCKQVTQAEALLEKALKGTDIHYKRKEYNVLKDLAQIYTGEINFEIGEKPYVELKREARAQGVDLRYRAVPINDYWFLSDMGISSVGVAAWLRKDSVNLVFLPEHSPLIDAYIKEYNKFKESKLQDAPAVAEPAESREQPVLAGDAR